MSESFFTSTWLTSRQSQKQKHEKQAYLQITKEHIRCHFSKNNVLPRLIAYTKKTIKIINNIKRLNYIKSSRGNRKWGHTHKQNIRSPQPVYNSSCSSLKVYLNTQLIKYYLFGNNTYNFFFRRTYDKNCFLITWFKLLSCKTAKQNKQRHIKEGRTITEEHILAYGWAVMFVFLTMFRKIVKREAAAIWNLKNYYGPYR